MSAISSAAMDRWDAESVRSRGQWGGSREHGDNSQRDWRASRNEGDNSSSGWSRYAWLSSADADDRTQWTQLGWIEFGDTARPDAAVADTPQSRSIG